METQVTAEEKVGTIDWRGQIIPMKKQGCKRSREGSALNNHGRRGGRLEREVTEKGTGTGIRGMLLSIRHVRKGEI